MGGIRLKSEFRPQFIGESEKHKLVSLFAEKQKKINEDSDAEESDGD